MKKENQKLATQKHVQLKWSELSWALVKKEEKNMKKSHQAKFRIENQEKLFYSFMAIDFVILDYHAIAIM